MGRSHTWGDLHSEDKNRAAIAAVDTFSSSQALTTSRGDDVVNLDRVAKKLGVKSQLLKAAFSPR